MPIRQAQKRSCRHECRQQHGGELGRVLPTATQAKKRLLTRKPPAPTSHHVLQRALRLQRHVCRAVAKADGNVGTYHWQIFNFYNRTTALSVFNNVNTVGLVSFKRMLSCWWCFVALLLRKVSCLMGTRLAARDVECEVDHVGSPGD